MTRWALIPASILSIIAGAAAAQTFAVDLSSYAKAVDLSSRAGVAAYAQLGPGPNTTNGGTVSLLGTGAYGFGQLNAKPILRCDYVGQSYTANLHGNYILATVGPGDVTAILAIGNQTLSTTISNFLTGTAGGWWDAESDLTCVTVGTNTATVMVGATITFQAAGGVTAAVPVGRKNGPLTITTNGGAFAFDLLRTFTNTSNTMQIETLLINWTR